MDKEPVYKQCYVCSNKKCNGWLFKGVADAWVETHCNKCNSKFRKELDYKAVSQKREGSRQRPERGNPKGNKTSDGRGQGAR